MESGTNDPTCTGSSAAPTAPAGVLCIYDGFQEGLVAGFPARYESYNPIDGTGTTGSSSKFGAAIYGYRAGANDYYAWGTWAVTKP